MGSMRLDMVWPYVRIRRVETGLAFAVEGVDAKEWMGRVGRECNGLGWDGAGFQHALGWCVSYWALSKASSESAYPCV